MRRRLTFARSRRRTSQLPTQLPFPPLLDLDSESFRSHSPHHPRTTMHDVWLPAPAAPRRKLGHALSSNDVRTPARGGCKHEWSSNDNFVVLDRTRTGNRDVSVNPFFSISRSSVRTRGEETLWSQGLWYPSIRGSPTLEASSENQCCFCFSRFASSLAQGYEGIRSLCGDVSHSLARADEHHSCISCGQCARCAAVGR